MPTNTTALYVTVREASALSSFSEYEIRNAINKGELPAIRRGTRLAIKVSELETWLDSHPSATDAA